MQKLMILILILTLILGVFVSCQKRYLPVDDETSCSPSEDTTKETNDTGAITTTEITQDTLDMTNEIRESESADEYYYTVKEIDGRYYIVPNKYRYGTPSDSVHYDSSIFFDSLDALKYTIPHGDLDSGTISSFLWDFGNPDRVDLDVSVGIPIYDIEHIWQPAVSDHWTLEKGVYWSGSYYTFKAIGETSDADKEFIELSVFCEDEYNDILDFYKNEQLAEMVTLENKTKTVHYNYVFDGESSDEEHHRYMLFVEQDNSYAVLYIRTFKALTNEDLLSFGLQKYEG